MKETGLFLRHILAAADDIAGYVADGREFFEKDKRTQDAIIRKIEIIGEATKRLSPAFCEAHPGIPWRRIAGMRDKLVHDYFGVDLNLVWATACQIVPPFRMEIARMIEALDRAASE